MKYTINDFNRQFPDDAACLHHIFLAKYPGRKGAGYYRIRTRQAYSNASGHQIYPLAGTIFQKSTTSLRSWFYAIYLFSQARHGVSASEMQRQLGVTYKCAWRMCHLIRKLMKEETGILSGTIECDEAYIGGKRKLSNQSREATNKTPVFGMVSRGGKVHAEPVENTQRHTLTNIIRRQTKKKTLVITDGYASYATLGYYKKRFTHKVVNHSKWEYVRKEGKLSVHTNTIEGFWSHLKRQVNGTHHSVSKQHLHSYVSEQTYRYNHRGELLFPNLLGLVSQRPEGR